MSKYEIIDGVGIIPEGTTIVEGDFLQSAFEDHESLKSVVIPDSVTEIGDSAFMECAALESVVIPDSVTEIGKNAFENCQSLKSIVIPDSVMKIGSDAFRGCTGLTSIDIPDSVTVIRDAAFRGCSGLTSIMVSEDNPVYDSRDSCNAIIETVTNKLISGCATTVIPDSVTEIGEDAFSGCTGLNSIVIPNSVTVIGGAFSHCTGLTSIIIPDSVTKIEGGTFHGCTGLTDIVIPDSVSEIGFGVFSRCTSLTSIVIPNSVAEIGSYTFGGCTGLNSIVIPNSVTEIRNNAFDGCTGLTSIVIPDSVKKIGDSAFRCCTGLTSIVIPDSVTMIGDGAFSGCTGLQTINVPAPKADYYKKRLPEELHHLIVELPAEKKGKNRVNTIAKKQFRVEITTKGSFDVEVTPIDTDEYNVDEITSDDFYNDFMDYSDYICNCALGDEWEGQFEMKVFDENDNVVYESGDFSEFLFVTDAERTEDEDFSSTVDPKKAAEECVKRWAEDGGGQEPGTYAVRRHENKWLSFSFSVEDDRFDPSKLFFVSNKELEGLVYDYMTDPDHVFYEDKFVETEVDEDYEEYGYKDFIMEKTEDGRWEVIRKV